MAPPAVMRADSPSAWMSIVMDTLADRSLVVRSTAASIFFAASVPPG
jgi:hypothetical protein